MIDILVPSLGRPQNSEPLVSSIHEATNVPVRILFICSPGDEKKIDACRRTGADVLIAPFAAARSDYPKKMNLGFRETANSFCLLAADDLDFRTGWDEISLALAEETGAGVIGTNDCANKEVMSGRTSTHPIVRRSYIESEGGSLDGPGVLIHEGYDHNYCERELNHLAQSRGKWAFASEAKIVHRHPCWGTAPMDATYRKGLRNMRKDQSLFYTRSFGWKQFGLYPNEIAASGRFQRRGSRLRAR